MISFVFFYIFILDDKCKVETVKLVEYDRNKTLLEIAAEVKKSQSTLDKRVIKQMQQQTSENVLLKEANQVGGVSRGSSTGRGVVTGDGVTEG